MKNEALNSPTKRIGHEIRFSLVWKLNIKLFFRLLGLFLVLDLALCLVSALGLIVRTEQTVAAVAARLNQTGLPIPDAENWLVLNGYSISLQTEEPKGFQLPQILLNHSNQIVSGRRSIDLPNLHDWPFWRQLEGVTYNAMIEDSRQAYLISIRFQETLRIFAGMFALVLILELLLLINSIFSGARTIRKILRPIEELAETAHNLTIGGVFTPEQLEVLTGKLDNINATKLDTRSQ